MIDVCDVRVMKPLLEQHGFHFSKAKGQNFLTQRSVPEQIAAEACFGSGVGALEIGPGIGPLTQQLCLRAEKVCAVEVDRRLEPILRQTVGEFSNLEIVWEDVLKLDIAALVREKFPGLRCVACANLPYYITTPILSALLEARCFETVTVMVQKEVAQRIAAEPGSGDYGAFSVFCQYYGEPELLFDVPPHCFMPQPKVTSAVVTLRLRREMPWDISDEALFFRTVRASFAMRRKKLSNGLAAGFPELGKQGAIRVLHAAGLDENVRGEELGIAQFARIADAIARERDNGGD